MKLSKTQEKILEKAKRTLEALRKYENFTQFFDNSNWKEQSYLPTASICNGSCNSSEKYKKTCGEEQWNYLEETYNIAVKEGILYIHAKTETMEALEKAGFIKIIRKAIIKGGSEKVKIL